jgi:transposase
MVPAVHAKTIGSQEIRPLLVARKQLLGKLLDVELSIRGILRDFGLKVGQVTADLEHSDICAWLWDAD